MNLTSNLLNVFFVFLNFERLKQSSIHLFCVEVETKIGKTYIWKLEQIKPKPAWRGTTGGKRENVLDLKFLSMKAGILTEVFLYVDTNHFVAWFG